MARPRKRSIHIELTGLSEPHAARLHHSIEALLRGAVPGRFSVSSNVDAKEIKDQAFNGAEPETPAPTPAKEAPRPRRVTGATAKAGKAPGRPAVVRKTSPTVTRSSKKAGPIKKAAPIKAVSPVKKAPTTAKRASKRARPSAR